MRTFHQVGTLLLFLLTAATPSHALCFMGFGNCLPDHDQAVLDVSNLLLSKRQTLPSVSFRKFIPLGFQDVQDFSYEYSRKLQPSPEKIALDKIQRDRLVFLPDVFKNFARNFRNYKCDEMYFVVSDHDIREFGSYFAGRNLWSLNEEEFIERCQIWSQLLKAGVILSIDAEQEVVGNRTYYRFEAFVDTNRKFETIFVQKFNDNLTAAVANFGTVEANKIYEQVIMGARIATVEFEVPVEKNKLYKALSEADIAICARAMNFGRCEVTGFPYRAIGKAYYEYRSDGWAFTNRLDIRYVYQ